MRSMGVASVLCLAMSVVAVGALSSACQGSDAGAVAHALTANTTSVVPWQAVVLDDTTGAFHAKSYGATLGGQSLTLVRLSATRLGFVTPQLQPGTYSLPVSAEGVTYPPVVFHVGAPQPAATDPVAAMHAAMDAAATSLQALQTKWANDATYKPIFDALIANLVRYRTEFDAMSPLDQATAVGILQANDPKNMTQFWGKWALQVVTQFVRVGLEIAAIDALGPAGLAVVPSFVADTGLLVDLFAAGVNELGREADQVQSNDFSNPQEMRRWTVWGETTLDAGANRTMSITPMTFPNGAAKAFTLSAPMVNVSSSDLQSSNPKVRVVAQDLEDFVQDLPLVNAVMNPQIPSLPDLTSIAQIKQDGPIDAASLEVSNVSNGVVLTSQQVSGTPSALQLTFTSSACNASSADVVFSFDVSHLNETSNRSEVVTIPGTLQCVRCKNHISDRGSLNPTTGECGIYSGLSSSPAWTCGADAYSITCACPSGICQCSKNGAVTVVPFAGCPGCAVPPAGIQTLCGFPLSD